MKMAGPVKHFIIAFAIALALYAVCFSIIERRRTKNGPWQVTFTNARGGPALVINESKLNLSGITISFPGQAVLASNSVMVFDEPREVPFDVPGGKCIFMDTTFQPGTIVFNLFGHEVQLIPRVLTIDRKERPWQSGATIEVRPGA